MVVIAFAAVAVNDPVVAPAATVTEAGTDSWELLLVSVSTEPPEGAAADNVAVQVLDPPAASEAGEQANELTPGTVTTAPDAEVDTAAADELTAIAPVKLTVVVVAEDANVPVTYASVPEARELSFKPVSRQVAEPLESVHRTDLAAAVAAGPALTVTPEISLGE